MSYWDWLSCPDSLSYILFPADDISCSSSGQEVFHSVWRTHSLVTLCHWMPGLIPYLGHCEECCGDHWCARVSVIQGLCGLWGKYRKDNWVRGKCWEATTLVSIEIPIFYFLLSTVTEAFHIVFLWILVWLGQEIISMCFQFAFVWLVRLKCFHMCVCWLFESPFFVNWISPFVDWSVFWLLGCRAGQAFPSFCRFLYSVNCFFCSVKAKLAHLRTTIDLDLLWCSVTDCTLVWSYLQRPYLETM